MHIIYQSILSFCLLSYYRGTNSHNIGLLDMSSPVSPCIFTRRGLWACSNGNGSASSWRTCGSQQPRESVWSPRLVGYLACSKMPGSHLQSSDWRGFLLQTFSMMLQHSSACYTQGPISTCSLQPVMIG